MRDGSVRCRRSDRKRNPSDHSAVLDGGVFNNNNNAIADVETLIGAISFLDVILVDDGDVGSDAGVFIENGAFHRGALPHPDRNPTTLAKHGTFITGFKEVSAHHQRVLQHHIGFDATAHTQDAVMNAAGLQNRTFTNDRIGDLSIIPRTWMKFVIHKRMPADFGLYWQAVLPDAAFIFNGKPYEVRCVAQCWSRFDPKPELDIDGTEDWRDMDLSL